MEVVQTSENEHEHAQYLCIL